MRIPPFDHYPKFLEVLALLLCGMIIGGAVFVAVYNQNFTLLYNKMIDLTAENKQLQTNIADLQKYKHKQSVINRIIIYTESVKTEREMDRSAEIKLKERIYDDMQLFKGKAIAEVTSHPEFIWKIIDGKIYANINEGDYLITVRMIAVIQSDLQLWVEVSPFQRNE